MRVITKESHPLICNAFETISHDSGKHVGISAIPTKYEVPDEFDVDKMEKVLAKLTPDERETLAIGEQVEMMGLWRTKPELEEIHFMFSAYSTDWADWRNTSGLEQIQMAVGMTLEEAKKIASEGEHATITYDLAQKILVEAGEYQLAYYAGEMAKAQRKRDAAIASFDAWREKFNNPRVADARGSRDDILLVVDSHHGQYGPQYFCEKFSFEDFCGTIDKEDWTTVLKGPEEEFYWEAWESIEQSAKLIINPHTMRYSIDGGNIEYFIHSSEGDIYLVPEGVDVEDNFS